MDSPHLKHPVEGRVIARLIRLLAPLALLALGLPVLAQPRIGTLLYDVDFATPPHSVGLAPATHPWNAQAPRNAPSNVNGDPQVLSEVGNLVNQPCSFGIGNAEDFDELRFITGQTYPNGFPYENWERLHIELNVAVHQLAGGSYFTLVIGNTYTITFIGGTILATGVPGHIGAYAEDDPVFVEVDVWLPGQNWVIRLDGVEVVNGSYVPAVLDYVRLISFAYDPLDQVGVDDLRICAGGDCRPSIFISQQPQSITACTGHDAAIGVLASGTPPLQYQWLHNNLEIPGATASTWPIQSVDHPDAGLYKVRVWNLTDTLMSYPGLLTVRDHVALALQPSPPAQTVCRGDTVIYSASASGSPPLNWRWRRNGQFVEGQTTSNFFNFAIDTSEAGVYDAIVCNECSSDTSNSVILAVEMAPLITVHPLSLTVCLGDSLSFHADAFGLPAPAFQWYHGGALLPGYTSNTIQIPMAVAGNAGTYTMRATNACGSVESNAATLVLLPLTVTVPTQAPTIQAGIDAVCWHGGVVSVIDGVYTGAGNRDINFHGKQITVQSASGNAKACVVDCQHLGRGFNFNSGEGSSSLLKGFTIRHGEAGAGQGGAILCNQSSPTIQQCIIEHSSARAGGGMAGICFSGALVGCTFTQNTADSLGGGLLLAQNSEPSPAANCTFYANSAVYGGGIGISNSNLILDNSIIAFGARGTAITCQNPGGYVVTLSCCDLYHNAGGDWNEPCISGDHYTGGNLDINPLFQDRFAGDLSLHANSPCAPFSPPNEECDLIGAWPVNGAISDDDGIFEYGVEYIDDYPGFWDDRTCGVREADSLDSVLGGWTTDWTQRFRKADDDANWRHWGEPEENSYVDAADLSYFSGHGTFSLDPYFGCNSSAVSFRWNSLVPSDCDGRWGESDAEWLGFTCCELLNDDDDQNWAAAFNGAHLILGYKTNSSQSNRAWRWTERMTSTGPFDPAKRVAWSWFKTCDLTQDDGHIARVLGKTTQMGKDYLWGQEGGPQPDPANSGYYTRWDHQKGDSSFSVPEARNTASLPASLPVYDVQPALVDSAGVVLLGNSLGVHGPVESNRAEYKMASGNLYLTVNANAGMDFGDLSRLWSVKESAPSLPTLSASIGIANGFLTTHGLLPADADPVPDAIYSDVQSLVNRASGEVEEEFTTQVQLRYHRHLGGYPVTGPGSHVLAYVGDGGSVDGLSKVWRTVSAGASVSLLDSAAVMRALSRHGQRLALGGMPAWPQHQLRALGLGYWEDEYGTEQAQLFPAYLLDMDFLRADTVITRDLVRVPAAEEFMPFLAYFENPASDSVFVLGEPIAFSGGADFGADPVTLNWMSELDGWRGSGGALLDSTLSEGMHTIALCAADSGGDSDTVRVDVSITSQVDFGDAPAPYPTLLADNGARHLNDGLTWLGFGVDNELNGVPSAAATGDDTANLDDEDGLVFLDEWSPGAVTRIRVTTSVSGRLFVWLDTNRDGDWSDAGDLLLEDHILAAGADTLELVLPDDASPGATYLRARFSNQAGLNSYGLALNGEVEDHAVEITCGLPCPTGGRVEGEPCGLRLNNGCNLAVPAFIDLDCGDTWCAETWADSPRRDSDWYQLNVLEPTRILLRVESEIPLDAGLVEQTVPGSEDCAGITGYVEPYMSLEPCTPDSLILDLPVAGTYWLITLPPGFAGYPCVAGPHRLQLSVTCLGLLPELEIAVNGSTVALAWRVVPSATRYHVFSADEPYPNSGSWTRETPAAGIADTTWSEAMGASRRFYRVVADNDVPALCSPRPPLRLDDLEGLAPRGMRPLKEGSGGRKP